METTRELMDIADKNKDKIQEVDYLKICNLLKQINFLEEKNKTVKVELTIQKIVIDIAQKCDDIELTPDILTTTFKTELSVAYYKDLSNRLKNNESPYTNYCKDDKINRMLGYDRECDFLFDGCCEAKLINIKSYKIITKVKKLD